MSGTCQIFSVAGHQCAAECCPKHRRSVRHLDPWEPSQRCPRLLSPRCKSLLRIRVWSADHGLALRGLWGSLQAWHGLRVDHYRVESDSISCQPLTQGRNECDGCLPCVPSWPLAPTSWRSVDRSRRLVALVSWHESSSWPMLEQHCHVLVDRCVATGLFCSFSVDCPIQFSSMFNSLAEKLQLKAVD